jgi:hypothetical protein
LANQIFFPHLGGILHPQDRQKPPPYPQPGIKDMRCISCGGNAGFLKLICNLCTKAWRDKKRGKIRLAYKKPPKLPKIPPKKED